MKNNIEVLKKIVDKKNKKLELNFLYSTGKHLIATDTARLMILDNEGTDTDLYIDVRNNNLSQYMPTEISQFEGILSAKVKGFKYPEWERILPSENALASDFENIELDDEDSNITICTIASKGYLFNVKFIQDLFHKKVNLEDLRLYYRDNTKLPFVIKGKMNGYSFSYVVAIIMP